MVHVLQDAHKQKDAVLTAMTSRQQLLLVAVACALVTHSAAYQQEASSISSSSDLHQHYYQIRGRDLTEPLLWQGRPPTPASQHTVLQHAAPGALTQQGEASIAAARRQAAQLLHRHRSLLQQGLDSVLSARGGGNFGHAVPLANGIGSSDPFQTTFGSGYQQLFGGNGAGINGMQLGAARLDDLSGMLDPANPKTRAQERAEEKVGGPRTPTGSGGNPQRSQTGSASSNRNAGSGDYGVFNGGDNAYVQQWQTQQGTKLVQEAVREQQQQFRSGGGPISDRSARIANLAYRYRLATKGLAAINPIVTPQMAEELGGSDDDPDIPSQPLHTRKRNSTSSSKTGSSGYRDSRPASGYLDEYDYEIKPLRYDKSGGSQTDRDFNTMKLMKYIQSKGPFGKAMDVLTSPDTPNMLDMVRNINDQVQKDRNKAQQAGARGASLTAATEQSLKKLLRAGYGDAADTITGKQLPYGGVVGDEAGKGFGYGDYHEEDYSDNDLPNFMRASYGTSSRPGSQGSSSIGRRPGQGGTGYGTAYGMGMGDGQGMDGVDGRRRNLSAGEIAPFCQPPILLCADRDLINFLATEIDQVRYPDNVLEWNSNRFRLERVYDNLFDNNLSPIAGPTININEVLAVNFRLRNTIAMLNGLNGIGTNRLTLQTYAWDLSRPDRILPDTFSWNSGGWASDNSFNRVDYLPTYIAEGTGPGFATTAPNFGPFTDFQVADFRS